MPNFPAPPAWHGRVLDLLDDPVGRAVMRRDGLTRQDVLAVMADAAAKLNASQTASQTAAQAAAQTAAKTAALAAA